MTEPSAYRDRGFGDEEGRHSRHKRTRGEGEEEEDVKRVRRRYDDYDYGYERKRSRSPRDRARRDERRRSEQRDYVSQSKNTSSRRDGREAHYANRHDPHDSHVDHRVIERSPSVSSSRHHDRHSSHHHHHHHHHRHRLSSHHSTRTPDELPFGARPLVRSDLETFKPLFAQYLDLQKRKDIAEMDEREIRGRWKSFMGKWNHGDLAEGWYRPETLEEARKSHAGAGAGAIPNPGVTGKEGGLESTSSLPLSERDQDGGNIDSPRSDEEDDEYGPTLPPGTAPTRSTAKHGPGIPSLQDLDLRRETAEEERLKRIDALRLARKADRAEQKARLEDLVPRAEPGTRERQLEKKREVNDKMRAFRERSPGGGAEVAEAELMGGGDGVAEYKRMKAVAERRKTEREVRREEEVRAREREREERVREYRRKEEGTMEVLKRIARERFG
ncbi:hypothetical protein F5Y06DRAFT_273851 [Hypoxylon sp. FL0890]|nr:hypothetical protein F5Y06DRAFT_273851 [Hypoxylon sp. FL0890]